MAINRIKWWNKPIENLDKNKDTRCVIVLPIYTLFINDFEDASMRQLINICGNKYNIVLLHPSKIEPNSLREIYNYNFSSVEINNEFFKSQKTYSDMCMKEEFYTLFSEFEYMLIYQLDAWIFVDKIDYFCNMGYDYYGAPHIWTGNNAKIGNGGFSLRKISALITACKTDFSSEILLEDRVLTEKYKGLKVCPLNIAIEFSWQDNPSKALQLNNSKFPMGAHALFRFKTFWENYLPIVNKWKYKVGGSATNTATPYVRQPLETFLL